MIRKLVITTAACIAALALPASSQAIVGGSLDGSSHPNVGALTVNVGGPQALACTGTLISPTVVVTAAHCTAELQQLGYSTADVSFDSNLGTGGDIVCHLTDCYVSPSGPLHTGTLHTDPLFDGRTTGGDSHDVAVVTLDKPVKGITPAPLPSARLLDGFGGTLGSQTLTNVGYGWHAVVDNTQKNYSGLFDGARRYATSGAQALTTSDLKLTENPTLGYGGACSHDSGGPTFLADGTIVAEISGLQSCYSTYYAYRLDTPSARAFLANYVTVP